MGDLEDRLFTMADKNVTKDGEIACVCMRMGDWDLHAGDSEGRNLGMWVDILRLGVLHHEINGKTASRQAILEALVRLNDKAVAFHKKFLGA